MMLECAFPGCCCCCHQALDQARQQFEQLKQQQQQQDGVVVNAEELERQVKMNGRLRAEVTRKEAALKVC
jgi:hypothetical protein